MWTRGTLIGLAVSGGKRSPLLPKVPTFAEAGEPAYDMSYWWGIAAPAGTPAPIIERLHREVVRACEKPRLREAFLQQAAVAVTSTPDEMNAPSRARGRRLARGDRAPRSRSNSGRYPGKKEDALSHPNEPPPAFRAPPLPATRISTYSVRRTAIRMEA